MAKVADSSTTRRFGRPRRFEKTFRGPIKERSCTDVICLVVFITFLCGWGYIAHFAFTNGHLARIVYPTDSRGQICGFDDTKTRPFLFYFDITTCLSPDAFIDGCLSETVCVEHCPNTTFTYFELLANPLKIDPTRLICVDDVDKNEIGDFETLSELVVLRLCAAYYFPSGPVGGRCLPGFSEGEDGETETVSDNLPNVTNADNQLVTFDDVLNGSVWVTIYGKTKIVFENVVYDYQLSWKAIVVGFGFSVILSLIWIILLRWFAGPLIWLTFAAILGGLSYGVYYCYTQYTKLRALLGTNSSMVTSDKDFSWVSANDYLTNPEVWLSVGIACFTILIIILLIVIFLRTRIRTAVALIRISSRAITHMTSTLLFPIFPLILQLIAVGACGACSVWLIATGEVRGFVLNSTDTTDGLRSNDTCNPNTFADTFPNATGICKFKEFRKYEYLIYFQVYNAFGFFWGIYFATALGELTLAGAFASYYWAWIKPDDVPRLPLLASFYRCCRFHLGSVACGSLLVAVLKLIQTILNYVQKKLKMANNAVTRFLIKCCVCCFYCLEKCIKFINRHAYIMIAIFGTNFCVSAKNAFQLLVRNAIRVVVVDSVVGFFMFFGKLVILGVLGTASYYFFEQKIPGLEQYAPSLNYIYVPIITIMLGSYIISSMFFGVYEMAIDTMFICFLEDLERHDGSTKKPYYMSKSLMEIYGKRNPVASESSNVDVPG